MITSSMTFADYIYKESIAGASAGVVGTVLGYPLDAIKTRQQITSDSIAGSIRGIYRESGMMGFYRGMASPMMSLTILNTLNFSTYSASRGQFGVPTAFDVTKTGFDWRIGMAGAVVGPLSALISTPFELVKTQMQLAARNAESGSVNKQQNYRNSIQAASYIVRNYGITALYKGHFVNTSREMVFLSTYFTVYEHLKSFQAAALSRGGAKGGKGNAAIIVPMSGGFAGAIGWLVSFPLDCVKSHLQGSSMQAGSASKQSAAAVATDLLRRKGLVGLYAGVVPSILRAFIVSSSRFSAYETTMWLLSQRE